MSTATEKPSHAKRTHEKTMYTEFGWTDSQQGTVLSAFYIGYGLFQIPSMALAMKPSIGPARTILISMIGANVFTLLSPVV